MPASRRRSLSTIVLAVVVIGLLVAGQLARRPRGASTRPSPAPPAPAHEAKPSRPAAAAPKPGPAAAGDKPAAASPAAASPPASTAPPSVAPAAPANVVAQQMRALDREDRALLAEAERPGSNWPPGVAGELVALQKRGTARTDLEAFIAERLHASIPARMSANRWLRSKFGDAAAAAGSGADAPKPVGKGGGTRRVTSLQPAAPE